VRTGSEQQTALQTRRFLGTSEDKGQGVSGVSKTAVYEMR